MHMIRTFSFALVSLLFTCYQRNVTNCAPSASSLLLWQCSLHRFVCSGGPFRQSGLVCVVWMMSLLMHLGVGRLSRSPAVGVRFSKLTTCPSGRVFFAASFISLVLEDLFPLKRLRRTFFITEEEVSCGEGRSCCLPEQPGSQVRTRTMYVEFGTEDCFAVA